MIFALFSRVRLCRYTGDVHFPITFKQVNICAVLQWKCYLIEIEVRFNKTARFNWKLQFGIFMTFIMGIWTIYWEIRLDRCCIYMVYKRTTPFQNVDWVPIPIQVIPNEEVLLRFCHMLSLTIKFIVFILVFQTWTQFTRVYWNTYIKVFEHTVPTWTLRIRTVTRKFPDFFISN